MDRIDTDFKIHKINSDPYQCPDFKEWMLLCLGEYNTDHSSNMHLLCEEVAFKTFTDAYNCKTEFSKMAGPMSISLTLGVLNHGG